MDITDEELDRYARIVADVARGEPIEAVVSSFGLDEATYEALELRIEDALSSALAEGGETPAPFVARYERALRLAQARPAETDAESPIALERFLGALAALSSGIDPVKALESTGLEVADLLRAASVHAPRLAASPELVEALQRAFSARSGER